VAIAAGIAVLAVAGSAYAAGTLVPPVPNLELRVAEPRVTPRALSRTEAEPVAFGGRATVSMRDGTHPPALREADLQLDREVKIDVFGLPACRYRAIAAASSSLAIRRCGDARIGSGLVEVHLAYPENRPIPLPIPVLLFNGGMRDGAIRLFAHSFVTIPQPQALVAPILIERREDGEFGWLARVRIPRLGDGYGSLAEVALKVGRRFSVAGERRDLLAATCSDGSLDLGAPRLLFRNDAGTPGSAPTTILEGMSRLTCRSTR
jgi:hypothetical protein